VIKTLQGAAWVTGAAGVGDQACVAAIRFTKHIAKNQAPCVANDQVVVVAACAVGLAFGDKGVGSALIGQRAVFNGTVFDRLVFDPNIRVSKIICCCVFDDDDIRDGAAIIARGAVEKNSGINRAGQVCVRLDHVGHGRVVNVAKPLFEPLS